MVCKLSLVNHRKVSRDTFNSKNLGSESFQKSNGLLLD